MKNLFLTLVTTFALLTFVGCYNTGSNSSGDVKTEKSAKCGDSKKSAAAKCGDAKKETTSKCGTGKCGDGK